MYAKFSFNCGKGFSKNLAQSWEERFPTAKLLHISASSVSFEYHELYVVFALIRELNRQEGMYSFLSADHIDQVLPTIEQEGYKLDKYAPSYDPFDSIDYNPDSLGK